ncbi:MAG: hypothetical protein JSV26_08050 [bacterium]|nr:MAG: hypothetical protein JSV26_08050 [bacterium]
MRAWTAVILISATLVLAGCPSRDDGAKSVSAPVIQLGEEATSLITRKMILLTRPVVIHLYRGSGKEKNTDKVEALLEIVAGASDNLSVVKHDLAEDPDLRRELTSDHGPIMVFEGPSEARISYYGYPERKELSPFLDGILISSGSTTPLTDRSRDFLGGLDREVGFKVFVTPD